MGQLQRNLLALKANAALARGAGQFSTIKTSVEKAHSAVYLVILTHHS